MQIKTMHSLWVALLVGTASAAAIETRTIEIPIGRTGEIQVSEIVSRLAKASGVALDLPAAGLTLSTQGFAGAAHPDACSPRRSAPRSRSRFDPERWSSRSTSAFWPRARRDEWLGRLRNLGDRAAEAVRKRQSYGMHALEVFSGE